MCFFKTDGPQFFNIAAAQFSLVVLHIHKLITAFVVINVAATQKMVHAMMSCNLFLLFAQIPTLLRFMVLQTQYFAYSQGERGMTEPQP